MRQKSQANIQYQWVVIMTIIFDTKLEPLRFKSNHFTPIRNSQCRIIVYINNGLLKYVYTKLWCQRVHDTNSKVYKILFHL